jgi:hypothetical protein
VDAAVQQQGSHLQQPPNDSTDDCMVLWAQWLEASRKDVERFFGVLKARWRILKIPFTLKTIAGIDNVVRACIVLHNWYHEWRLNREQIFADDPDAAMGLIDGEFSPYCNEERDILQAAADVRVKAGMRRRLRVGPDGEQEVVLRAGDKARMRLRLAAQYDSTMQAGVVDADDDSCGARISDNNNVRPPPADAAEQQAKVAQASQSDERRNALAKRKALAQHIHYLQRNGELRWKTYTRTANIPSGKFLDIGARLMEKFRLRGR